MGRHKNPNTPSEKEYQHQYYMEHRQERLEYKKRLWATDANYRQMTIDKARARRAVDRAKTYGERRGKRIEKAREDKTQGRRPRLVQVDGCPQWVFGTRVLGRMLGRKNTTVRGWVANGVIPGCSVLIGGRAHFSEKMIRAIVTAHDRLLLLDGRCNLGMFRRFILEEFEKQGLSYVKKEKPDGKKEKSGKVFKRAKDGKFAGNDEGGPVQPGRSAHKGQGTDDGPGRVDW